MTAEIIDGRKIGLDIREELKSRIEKLSESGQPPGLAVVLVGHNQASKTYVSMKQKACSELGIYSELIELPEETTEAALLEVVNVLNENDRIHGILVQLPLPDQISEAAVIEAIKPEKDVDGFHPVNIGRMQTGGEAFFPCTPYGIIKMLEHQGINIAGKHAVIVGRSNIVGKPMGQLLLNKHATVTICHSRTENLAYHTKQADIVIAAVGIRHLITADHIKEGAVVIDVGMNRDDAGKLCGDVDFEGCKDKASAITPVPGGVGPMTITMLLANTTESAERARTK
ncbi:bifunctional methylenetetrahydrofolate dehydrogenase/methenyltetrahydrofolate cyclohydrolase FolD [Jeotgalibacillus sp. R-1-5s-1]|uniref:bifunctional methylenetetrahydrofolate dehydrogenase/methenyltetrahydrofolate cyclohydrolase FolD n=1 Tax=Jeotgalibacillus sp. R-1-5s-1 TaxID=2555897 RepID=UPI00106D2E18|nr:bifunctional methylenetetrahydrofolate dehydrogenase/methenyltetrahydrofolate cyclohydrolase FolD [Jeotgalibacillus sp. R-1-5s-1]TFD92243.1 bifunctional methylenetetrahydrofolate dehydrogenase/methenyltetrahydrofolate cyclohydrolase FolD [Jeotgalibacillus sp. R-1-5s-1]